MNFFKIILISYVNNFTTSFAQYTENLRNDILLFYSKSLSYLLNIKHITTFKCKILIFLILSRYKIELKLNLPRNFFNNKK